MKQYYAYISIFFKCCRKLFVCLCIVLFAGPIFSTPQKNIPIDISGYWEADKTEEAPFTLFQFTISHDQLRGTARVSGLGRSRIIDGRIHGETVNFSTLHQVAKEHAQYNRQTGQWSRPTYIDLIFQYQGTIAENTISFIRQGKHGYFADFTARKVVDKIGQLAHTQESYTLAYSLPGHEGGVNSISFGPLKGRYANGGLRLASGGSRDGLVKFWNLATGEDYGNHDMKQGMPPDDAMVIVKYAPQGSGRGVSLQAVAVSSLGFFMSFYDIYDSGASGRSPDVEGVVKKIVFSPDTGKMAFSEIMEDQSIYLHIGDPDNNKSIKTLKTLSRITALAFDPSGERLAVAEAEKQQAGVLKLILVEDGSILWQVSTPFPMDTLTFHPKKEIIAAGGRQNPGVHIFRGDTGKQVAALEQNFELRGVRQVVFSQDGSLMAACSPGSPLISLWYARDKFVATDSLDNQTQVTALSLNHDGSLVAVGHEDHPAINVWAKGKLSNETSATP